SRALQLPGARLAGAPHPSAPRGLGDVLDGVVHAVLATLGVEVAPHVGLGHDPHQPPLAVGERYAAHLLALHHAQDGAHRVVLVAALHLGGHHLLHLRAARVHPLGHGADGDVAVGDHALEAAPLLAVDHGDDPHVQVAHLHRRVGEGGLGGHALGVLGHDVDRAQPARLVLRTAAAPGAAARAGVARAPVAPRPRLVAAPRTAAVVAQAAIAAGLVAVAAGAVVVAA